MPKPRGGVPPDRGRAAHISIGEPRPKIEISDLDLWLAHHTLWCLMTSVEFPDEVKMCLGHISFISEPLNPICGVPHKTNFKVGHTLGKVGKFLYKTNEFGYAFRIAPGP